MNEAFAASKCEHAKELIRGAKWLICSENTQQIPDTTGHGDKGPQKHKESC